MKKRVIDDLIEHELKRLKQGILTEKDRKAKLILDLIEEELARYPGMTWRKFDDLIERGITGKVLEDLSALSHKIFIYTMKKPKKWHLIDFLNNIKAVKTRYVNGVRAVIKLSIKTTVKEGHKFKWKMPDVT